ncbi:MAG: CDP-glucose 4,6-dehydratase [Elusimicrobia bacterium]|nr:CDP-glucose 4,6-dehydratase [Elusimicrobiota bacterium]
MSRFKGKRVFVTGHTGFKGSWLCLWLKDLGAEVFGYALAPQSDHDLYCRLGLSRLIGHLEADIRDAELLREAVRDFRPEFMFHLAAQPLVRLSYEQPLLTFETNVLGSLNALEAARGAASLRAMVYVTSDKCYENKGLARGCKEDDALGGADPYSASKACAELVLRAYQRSFFAGRATFGAASARAGNVIGGGDWAADRIVPDAVRALVAGKPLVLRNPGAVRPWQHVLDPLYGYLMLAARLYDAPKAHAGAWNFGPELGQSRSVRELAKRLAASWGKPLKLEIERSVVPEARSLKLDSGRARRLGWRPRWDFSRAVSETASWYQAVAGGQDALAVTRRQIGQYMV